LPKDFLQIKPEVARALAANHPVVALESTVIAHGLPRPQNFQTAQHLEQIVREVGAVPATIAILNGRIYVGLNEEQLKHIASSTSVHKISCRDLPIAIIKGWDAATTVAASIWVAALAGIEVFATGGIGGIHRGASSDVSADLPELARTSILVACSGAKSVLDLAATREWLETHGVTVLGFGCDEMPAFYSRTSGLMVDARVDSVSEAADYARVRRTLNLIGATLLTIPVPEEFEIPAHELETVLRHALREAQDKCIGGRDLTPFLLTRMSDESKGATLRANIALLENNARIAAQVAKARAK
jgi:pseudouridine-5'-phosphate glycosidase